MHFQGIDLDRLNYDQLILKTEESLLNYHSKDIMNKYKDREYAFKDYYPIMNELTYLEKFIIDRNIKEQKGKYKWLLYSLISFVPVVIIGLSYKWKY